MVLQGIAQYITSQKKQKQKGIEQPTHLLERAGRRIFVLERDRTKLRKDEKIHLLVAHK